MYFFNNKASDLNVFFGEAVFLEGFRDFVSPTAGDVFSISFHFRGWNNIIEGFCLKTVNAFINPDISFLLRNNFFETFVEFSISFYYQRVFNLSISKFKRKKSEYSRAKLYFLRLIDFRASFVPK